MGVATIIPGNYISGCKKWAIKYNESDVIDFLTLDEIMLELIDTDF